MRILSIAELLKKRKKIPLKWQGVSIRLEPGYGFEIGHDLSAGVLLNVLCPHQPPVDRVQTFLDHAQAAFYLVRLAVDLIQSALGLVQAFNLSSSSRSGHLPHRWR